MKEEKGSRKERRKEGNGGRMEGGGKREEGQAEVTHSPQRASVLAFATALC